MKKLLEALAEKSHELCCEIDKLPASEQQTRISLAASEILRELNTVASFVPIYIKLTPGDGPAIADAPSHEPDQTVACVPGVLAVPFDHPSDNKVNRYIGDVKFYKQTNCDDHK